MSDNHEWFKQAKYGMMVHWGLYSLLAGEYRGQRTPSYAEWVQSHFGIKRDEYEHLAEAFNPLYFNAEEWVLLAKRCGMNYIVVTSKHHDGFAMFKSEADKFNVVDATPFKRDVIGEIAEACYKHGLKLGLYYSQELDWHEPNGGGASHGIGCAGISYRNTWDYPDESKVDFAKCFENKIKPQVKEILTKYGELCLIWFDVPMIIKKEQSLELYNYVKEYQPNCLINSRLGNGAYDYVSLGDNEVPPEFRENSAPGDLNDLGGFKYSPYGLYETPATLNDTWGYKYYDHNWKSPEKIKEIRRHLNSMGVNYLLNVGPDPLGRIPSISQDILLKSAD